ncbi:hemolysin family protein [uncultured Lentibacter sp.]|uniref:hemolysin family protein n=1 Tax=uncultured Lentibacter sp. TaxID=1659309 RepID=UPI002625CC36|nr:hemolysin family protein [uncultured Lentibacter sp.]
MGDSKDGSSSAAQSALPHPPLTSQSEPQPPVKTGVFKRIFSALGPKAPRQGAPVPTYTPGAHIAHGVLNLRRMAVEDVMLPAAEIVAVPANITKDELVTVFRESGLTRLPVYEDTLDSPIGMAHLKDFALQHGFNGAAKGRFSLKALLRPLMFVPPSMPIGVLLAKMQAERKHMALVIDEYGGVDGLVTIEDLIEQVVGEIEDEHDAEEDVYFTADKKGGYLALAKTPLDEFEQEIGLPLTDVDEVDGEEVDTLGGLVFMLTGRVPVRGEVVKHPEGFEFEVVDADPRRIKRLRVRLPDHAERAARATAATPKTAPNTTPPANSSGNAAAS